MTSIGQPQRERTIQPDVIVVPPKPAREPVKPIRQPEPARRPQEVPAG